VTSVGPSPVAEVNLAEKLQRIQESWRPIIVGRVGDIHGKLVKLKGRLRGTATPPKTSSSSRCGFI